MGVQEQPPEPQPLKREDVVVAQSRCPFCRTQVESDAASVVCKDCLTRHHAACWSEAGKCSSCGQAHGLVDMAPPFDWSWLRPVIGGLCVVAGLIWGAWLMGPGGTVVTTHPVHQDLEPAPPRIEAPPTPLAPTPPAPVAEPGTELTLAAGSLVRVDEALEIQVSEVRATSADVKLMVGGPDFSNAFTVSKRWGSSQTVAGRGYRVQLREVKTDLQGRRIAKLWVAPTGEASGPPAGTREYEFLQGSAWQLGDTGVELRADTIHGGVSGGPWFTLHSHANAKRFAVARGVTDVAFAGHRFRVRTLGRTARNGLVVWVTLLE